MSWASHPTAEMSTSPPARHRRRGGRPVLAVGVGVLLMLLATTAMFSYNLLGWGSPYAGSPAPSADGLASSAALIGTATSPPLTLTPTATPIPSPAPSETTPPTPKTSKAAGAGTTTDAEAAGLAALEVGVLAATNAERRVAGCDELRMDDKLRDAARMHSADMINSGYFSHTSPDGRGPGERLREAGYDTSGGWAENIARGYPTAARVMDAWMASQGHRENILNCSMQALGVGVARAGNGQLTWTQDFGGR